ncbi:MAG: hypothetical protein GX591_14030 [Planctomycetes bacterium]|nr:hypothetical protein [Planctomycetota bacterium]
MPIPLSPHETFPLTLKSDESLEAARRPTFVFLHLSGREERQFAALLDALEAEKEYSAALLDRIFDALRFVLAGWERLTVRNRRMAEVLGLAVGAEVPYDPAVIEDVLQYREARELVYAAWAHRPGDDALNFSGSPSSTPSAASAPPAAAGGA